MLGEVRYTCLKLGQRLGAEVFPQLPRRQQKDPTERTAELVEELCSDSCMSAKIRIPGTVADLEITCDLRGQQLHASVVVPASGHARNHTRVRWLLRQIPEEQTDIVIEANYRGRREAAPIEDARADESVVIPDPNRELSRFRVTRIYPMGLARSVRSKSSFIHSVTSAVDDFYAEILQRLKPWNPPAPKFRDKPEPRQQPSDELSSTDLSSMDGPEPAEVPQT